MSVSRAHLLGSAFTLAALGTTAHAGVVINPGGAGLRIEVETDGRFQIRRGEEVQLAGDGIVAAVGAKRTTWTAGSQSAVLGDGTAESPYLLETIVIGDDVKLQVTFVYVAGEQEVGIALQVWAGGETVRVYHLIDNLATHYAASYWEGAPDAPSALGIDLGSTSVSLVAGSAFHHFHAGEAGMPAILAAGGQDLGDELDAARDYDRSIAAQWAETVSPFSGSGGIQRSNGTWLPIHYRLRFSGAVCGDGVLGGAEACDDGNGVTGDACTSTCTIPRDDEEVVNEIGPSRQDPDAPDDVGPPPGGPGPRELDDEDPTITSGDDEPGSGSPTDDDDLATAGCAASHGGAGGGILVLLGLAAMRRRRAR